MRNYSLAFLATILLLGCSDKTANTAMAEEKTSDTHSSPQKTRNLSEEFKNYWYDGEAEISSYKLAQARYGELREGTAALIYVTEDFLPNVQVKADRQQTSNISVLKLNSTKNFVTGIYPYSIMTSTFYPVAQKQHALKIAQSVQEWCGQVYAQLNNRTQYEIKAHSYFQGEADQDFTLAKDILENELWTQLRINPKELPTGKLQVIPDFSYLRLKHQQIKAYAAFATLTKGTYSLTYPDLKRSLILNFDPVFPYTIQSWEETYESGFGQNAQSLKTTAVLMEQIKSPYWQKNSVADTLLRRQLNLN